MSEKVSYVELRLLSFAFITLTLRRRTLIRFRDNTCTGITTPIFTATWTWRMRWSVPVVSCCHRRTAVHSQGAQTEQTSTARCMLQHKPARPESHKQTHTQAERIECVSAWMKPSRTHTDIERVAVRQRGSSIRDGSRRFRFVLWPLFSF